MILSPTSVSSAYIVDIEPKVDSRGFFSRTFCREELGARGIDFSIAQESISYNKVRGTLRGIHFQNSPEEEGKIVRCTRGAIFDVVVDLRKDSPTYLKWDCVELSHENRRALYIPEGCGHGFLTLSDDAEVFYLINRPYKDGYSAGYRYDDAAFGIQWPFLPAVISERDLSFPPHG